MNPIPNLDSFTSLDLQELDRKASLLSRVDNKYIVRGELSANGIKKLQEEFDVLSIDNKRIFGYENIYFDDGGVCFHRHSRGKRKRFKARTRVYLDSDELTFFEVKLAGQGRKVDKYRISCGPSEHGALTDHFAFFLKARYFEQYHKRFNFELVPTVKTAYRRITLVAKNGGERLTIDHDISLGLNDVSSGLPSSISIFETKSKNGRGIADKILSAASIPRVKGCSKFCLSMALGGKVTRFDKFLALVRNHFQASPVIRRHS